MKTGTVEAMAGIFYDPRARRLYAVDFAPNAEWTLITHNPEASAHQCRRIMCEWLRADDLDAIDWTVTDYRRSAGAA